LILVGEAGRSSTCRILHKDRFHVPLTREPSELVRYQRLVQKLRTRNVLTSPNLRWPRGCLQLNGSQTAHNTPSLRVRISQRSHIGNVACNVIKLRLIFPNAADIRRQDYIGDRLRVSNEQERKKYPV